MCSLNQAKLLETLRFLIILRQSAGKLIYFCIPEFWLVSSETTRLTSLKKIDDDIVQFLPWGRTGTIIYLCLTNLGIILLSFIHVSGIKNKMRLCNFSSGAVQHTQNGKFNDNIVNINDEFLYWFSGFTDFTYNKALALIITKKNFLMYNFSLV